jgi:hypothetical protein
MPNRDSRATRFIVIRFFEAVSILAATGATYAQSPVTPPGSGTQADPYQISQLGHLVWMGDTVASSSGKYYTMTADIDASATATWNEAETSMDVLEGFSPIGNEASEFSGIFDGVGHTISRYGHQPSGHQLHRVVRPCGPRCGGFESGDGGWCSHRL